MAAAPEKCSECGAPSSKFDEVAEAMPDHVCPWWLGFFIDNRLRRMLHNPEKIVGLRLVEEPWIRGCRAALLEKEKR